MQNPIKYIMLLCSLVFLVVIVLFGLIFFRVSALSRETAVIKDSITLNTRTNKETIESLRQNSVLLSRDLNRVHSLLNLPKTKYPLITSEETPEKTEEEENYLAFLKAIQTLMQHEKHKVFIEQFTETIKRNDFRRIVEDLSLELLRVRKDLALLKKNGITYFELFGNPEEDVVTVSAFTGDKKDFSTTSERSEEPFVHSKAIGDFIASTYRDIEQVRKRSESLKSLLLGLKEKEDVVRLINEKNLLWGSLQVFEKEYLLPIKTKDGRTILEPGINRSLGTFLLEREFSDFDTFLSAFIQKLDDLDGRTDEEKSLDAAFDLIKSIIKKGGVENVLDSYGLKVRSQTRDDDDYYYFDILSTENNHIGAFAVLKKEGEIYLTDSDDIVISSIKTLHSSFKMDEQKKN
jgi:hypothetical protein